MNAIQRVLQIHGQMKSVHAAFRDQLEQNENDLGELLKEAERREAYEVRPATIGEIEDFLPQSIRSDKVARRCAAYTFTLKRTNESRTIIASPGIDPTKLDADDLDMLWSRFEPKN